MKKIFACAFLLQMISSCAFLFNGKETTVEITSNPAGADIMINDVYYGKTPATLNLVPENYNVVLNKVGYGTAQFKLESWQAVRAKKGEGGRCLADAFGTVFVLPALSYWSVYCRDFKQSRYNIAIPYMGPVGASQNAIGIDGIKSAQSPYSGGFPRDDFYSQEPYYDRPYNNAPKRY